MKISKWFLFLAVGMIFLSGCTTANSAAQTVVALPDDVKIGIMSVILVAVSWIFARLIALVPPLKFLDQFREPLAMAISIELINLIQAGVPDAFGAIAVLALKLVLAVLALFLTASKLREQGVKAFR